MGIFDLFKKLVQEQSVEEIIIEKLAFSDIDGWVENKIKENVAKQDEIILVIKDKIELNSDELIKKIKILEDFDVEAKKEKEEIKGIVNNNRKDYIRAVETFLETLNNLEMNNFEESMDKINKIFLDFNKSSYKNYERATILIGKEMRSIKDSIRVFSKEITKTFDESKDVVDSFKKISSVKSKLDMVPPIDETLGIIGETISSLDGKIESKEEENKKLLEEIEKVKESDDYLERLRTQKKIEFLKEELKNDVFRLKQLLDFKALANFFHINEEQIRIVKDHREDFQTNFQKDQGKMIIDLLDEAKLNNNTILEKVSLIRAKTEETSNYAREIKEDKTPELYSRIKIVVLDLDNLKIEKVKEEKRDEKIGMNKEELIDSLKQELDEMNVEVIS